MNNKPKIFIASSGEGHDLVEALQDDFRSLHFDVECRPWYKDFFTSGSITLTTLLDALDEYSYAIFVCTFEDTLLFKARDSQGMEKILDQKVIRDNVVFELGLFMGHHSTDFKEHCFVLCPEVALSRENQLKYHRPTDFQSLNILPYDSTNTDLHKALMEAAKKIQNQMNDSHFTSIDISGKWLHIHDKTQIRIGCVEIFQKGNIITGAKAVNVTPAKTDFQKKVTHWKYNQGMIHLDSDGTASMIAIYDANSDDAGSHNDGLHIVDGITADEHGNIDFMEGKFQDIYQRAHDTSLDEHTGKITFYRMSEKIEKYLDTFHSRALKRAALSELYLDDRFQDELFVTDLKNLLEERKHHS